MGSQTDRSRGEREGEDASLYCSFSISERLVCAWYSGQKKTDQVLRDCHSGRYKLQQNKVRWRSALEQKKAGKGAGHAGVGWVRQGGQGRPC